MRSGGFADQFSIALATTRATQFQRRIALVIAAVCLLVFLGIAPFVRTPLPPMPAFIPAYQTALFFIDLITAALLIDQCLRLRSLSLLFLAAGYLFDALMIVSHTLSFPGAFSRQGLMGSGPQTTAWLYVFWHGGFPLFVLSYVVLRDRDAATRQWMEQPRTAAAIAVAGVLLLAVGLTLAATAGHDLLPVVMQGNDYSLLVSKGVSPAVWLLTLAALVLLWQREIRIVDLWLMLVMWVWLFDIALSAILGANRFDFGFYAGRIFGLVAASFLLVALVVEMAQLYAGAMRALVAADEKLGRAEQARKPAEETAGGLPPGSRPQTTVEAFIRQQNIAHYRKLLGSGTLNEVNRRTIEQLLENEERSETGRLRG